MPGCSASPGDWPAQPHRHRGSHGTQEERAARELTHQSVPTKQHELILKPRLQKQKCWASTESSEEQEALPIWGTHGLLHARNLKVISTAGALTAALLHCQPFHVGIKHHLIVSTKIISNSQKASTTCHVQASELRSSWRTGAVSHRLWHHCTGICVQPALYLQFQSFSCSTPGRKSPALATTFPELLPATPHSISSPKKSPAESPRKNQQLNEALKQNTTENTLTKAVFPELDKPPKSTICKTIWRQTGRHMMSSKKVCQPSAEEYNKCVGSVLDGWEIWVLPRKQENWTHSDSQRLVQEPAAKDTTAGKGLTDPKP